VVEIDHVGGNEPLYRVSNGEADVAVSLTVAAAQAAKSVGVYKDGKASPRDSRRSGGD
jgi:hypothetical protein